MKAIVLIVGIALLCAILWITSKLRYWSIRAITLIPRKLGEAIVRFWFWVGGSGNRSSRILATFTIVLLLVSIGNVAVMALDDSPLEIIKSSISLGNTICIIKGNISRTGEHIYHTLQSPYYFKTKIHTHKGERWFCTVEEAEAAGWRPPYK